MRRQRKKRRGEGGACRRRDGDTTRKSEGGRRGRGEVERECWHDRNRKSCCVKPVPVFLICSSSSPPLPRPLVSHTFEFVACVNELFALRGLVFELLRDRLYCSSQLLVVFIQILRQRLKTFDMVEKTRANK